LEFPKGELAYIASWLQFRANSGLGYHPVLTFSDEAKTNLDRIVPSTAIQLGYGKPRPNAWYHVPEMGITIDTIRNSDRAEKLGRMARMPDNGESWAFNATAHQ
jgi:hypothetical protein